MRHYSEQTIEELSAKAKMHEEYLSEGGHSRREINRIREDLLHLQLWVAIKKLEEEVKILKGETSL